MANLHEVEIHKLRPTQITVGMIEVHDKRAKLESLKKHEQRAFMEAHPIPAVWGPDGKLYITDHHHLGRAACEANVDTGFFWIEGDFTKLPIAQFWPKMNNANWAHPIDQNGRLCGFEAIPNHLVELRDDPYRSLAGYVRVAGGYDKTPTAFAEFQRAHALRLQQRRAACPGTRGQQRRREPAGISSSRHEPAAGHQGCSGHQGRTGTSSRSRRQGCGCQRQRWQNLR
jgi:hypothetical protein